MPGNGKLFMKKTAAFLSLLILFMMLGGCRMIKIEEAERTPLKYTVADRSQIPEEAAKLIEEKKEKEFQMVYQKGEDLYLIKGYGRQMSGGYSIQVEELGVSSNGLFFVTRLIGPKDLNEAGVPSYPCIVIKTEPQKKPVVFREGKADSGSEKGE